MHEKYNDLKELSMENFQVTMQNRKREEKLHQRVCALEEENNKLMKQLEYMTLKHEKTEERVELYKEHFNEMVYNHNTMITTINTIIAELNDVISVLNNKHQENYYVLRVLCKKSLIGGFFARGILKIRKN